DASQPESGHRIGLGEREQREDAAFLLRKIALERSRGDVRAPVDEILVGLVAQDPEVVLAGQIVEHTQRGFGKDGPWGIAGAVEHDGWRELSHESRVRYNFART